MEAIKTNKADSINIIFKLWLSVYNIQIMFVSILKNWSRIYSSNYIIKFVCFMSIYYLLTSILFHSLWFFAFYILDLLIYDKFESIKLFFL